MSHAQTSPTARDLATYLLQKAQQTGDALTLMKLNALLYYAEAWSLAVFDGELIREELQAWDHGPVFPSLWENLKHRGWNTLATDDLSAETRLDSETSSLLDDVWQAYGEFPLPDLEKMIKQDAPWKEARHGLPAWDLSKKPMSKALMQSFYKAVFEAGQNAPNASTHPVRNTPLGQQY